VIKSMALLGAISALITYLFAGPAQAERYDVVVVGGGISGLTAAYELTKAGKSVLVLEKEARFGGRIKTKRWPSGQYSEEGAEDIIDNEENLLGLIKDLGLSLAENEAETDAYYFKGKYFTSDDWDEHHKKVFSRATRHLAFSALVDQVVDDIGHVKFPLKDSAHVALESIDIETWIKEFKGDSTVVDFIGMLLRPEIVGSLKGTSALYGAQSLYDIFEGTWYHVKGGNETIIQELVKRLEGKLQLQAKVTHVTESDSEISLKYTQNGNEKTVLASHAIVAVPSYPLLQINFSPKLDSKRIEALKGVKWGKYVNAHLRFSERVWKTKYNLNTWDIFTDGPASIIVDATYNQEGPEGILSVFFVGEEAERLSKLEDAEVYKVALGELEKFWPGISKAFIDGINNHWPYAVPLFGPGYLTKLQPELRKPHGRVFFAGDYTEQPGLDGAVYSAIRAVKQLTEK